MATVPGHGDLLTLQTFPSLVTAPWSRKRAGNCRANVCKREPGCGRSAEPQGSRGTRRRCQPPGGGESGSGPQPACAVTPYVRAVLGAGSQDGPWGCLKLTRTRKETAKSCAQGERSGRVLPPAFSRCQKRQNLRAHPKNPFPKHPRPQVLGLDPQAALPTLTPRLIAAASRPSPPKGFLRSRLFPSSCRRDRRALGSRPSPEIRPRRAAGQGQQRPFRARATLLFGIPRENNRSYFRLYGSGESPRPSAASKDTAASQGLADPPGSPALSPPSSAGTRWELARWHLCSGKAAMSRRCQGLGAWAGASWQGAELEGICWHRDQANGSPGGTRRSQDARRSFQEP